MTADDYVQSVIDYVPRGLALRDAMARELRSHMAERQAHGQPLDEVIRQLGDPRTLAESYLAAVPLRSAAFLPRAAAKLIDFLVIVAFVGGLAAFLWMLLPPAVVWFLPPLCIMGCLLGLLGYTILAEHHAGQTIGKRLMGIHVVRESGARISLGQSAIRQLPLLGQIFIIDVLFALFTERHQRAFELITKTRAVAAQ